MSMFYSDHLSLKYVFVCWQNNMLEIYSRYDTQFVLEKDEDMCKNYKY